MSMQMYSYRFQVAPAELEGLLLGHKYVADVAVIGVYSNEVASELPRAYVVLQGDVRASRNVAGDISKWLNEQVAQHKRLRGGIRFVDVIPKSAAGKSTASVTSNPIGKILRRVLREEAKNDPVKAKI